MFAPFYCAMKIESNDFELFATEACFALDASVLDRRWLTLQAEVHPDRFVTQGAAAQRVAMQWAVRVNEAYRRLKNPLKRAAYLCHLNGAAIDAESNTSMPTGFLMQQMEWREALDDADSLVQVESLSNEVAKHSNAAFEKLANTLDFERDFAAGAQQVRALMFVERFAHDIDQRLEALGQ